MSAFIHALLINNYLCQYSPVGNVVVVVDGDDLIPFRRGRRGEEIGAI